MNSERVIINPHHVNHVHRRPLNQPKPAGCNSEIEAESLNTGFPGDWYTNLQNQFLAYAQTFANASGQLPFASFLKLSHTMEVCRYMKQIILRSQFPETEHPLFFLAALFHDVSRFEQLQQYHTFRDAVSFDHGARSVQLLRSGKFELPGITPEQLDSVIAAIAAHNQKVFTPNASDLGNRLAYALRDADKLSILHILVQHFQQPVELRDHTLELNLPESPGYTPNVVQCALAGQSVNYGDLRNVNDFKIALFAWSNDLFFPATRQLVREADFYGRLFRDWNNPDTTIQALFQQTQQKLLR